MMRTSFNGSVPYVAAAFGYGRPEVYHYRLSTGAWLICRLQGLDMQRVIDAVESGALTGFEIEAPANG